MRYFPSQTPNFFQREKAAILANALKCIILIMLHQLFQKKKHAHTHRLSLANLTHPIPVSSENPLPQTLHV